MHRSPPPQNFVNAFVAVQSATPWKLLTRWGSSRSVIRVPRFWRGHHWLGLILSLAAYSSSAHAQALRPMSTTDRQTASQPRLSPYLNLLREDNSTLSPYHSFVRPQRLLQQQQALQAAEIARLERTSSISKRTERAPAERLPTGNAAQFQAYSHFYQFHQLQPKR